MLFLWTSVMVCHTHTWSSLVMQTIGAMYERPYINMFKKLSKVQVTLLVEEKRLWVLHFLIGCTWESHTGNHGNSYFKYCWPYKFQWYALKGTEVIRPRINKLYTVSIMRMIRVYIKWTFQHSYNHCRTLNTFVMVIFSFTLCNFFLFIITLFLIIFQAMSQADF